MTLRNTTYTRTPLSAVADSKEGNASAGAIRDTIYEIGILAGFAAKSTLKVSWLEMAIGRVRVEKLLNPQGKKADFLQALSFLKKQ